MMNAYPVCDVSCESNIHVISPCLTQPPRPLFFCNRSPIPHYSLSLCAQVILLLCLLFEGSDFFGVPAGDWCAYYNMHSANENYATGQYSWNPSTGQLDKTGNDPDSMITCATFDAVCPDHTGDCFDANHIVHGSDFLEIEYTFNDLEGFANNCLECEQFTYVHTTIIFNSFVFCQLFNEFNARSLFDDVLIFKGLHRNPIFSIVIVTTVLFQFIIVTFGGEFTRTSPLSAYQWMLTVCFALLTFPVGFLMRFIPVVEDESDYFDSGGLSSEITAKAIAAHALDDSKSRASWWDQLGGSRRGHHVPLPTDSSHANL